MLGPKTLPSNQHVPCRLINGHGAAFTAFGMKALKVNQILIQIDSAPFQT
jgi:hypothetical protein